MKLKNICYGLFLCSFASLALAGDEKVKTYRLIVDEDSIEQQVKRFNYGEASEQVPVKSVTPANLKEIKISPADPLGKIVHKETEENVKSDDVAVKEEAALKEEPAEPSVITSAPVQEDKAKNDVDASGKSVSEQSEGSNVSDSSKPTDKEIASPSESSVFSFLPFKEASKQQLFALTAGAMVVGYGIYKVWNMLFASIEEIEEELKITLTVQDREVLFALIHAMAGDIQNLRENKHEASLVGRVDLSPLSEVLAPECKALTSNFVELYNAIDLSGNNIEFIIMFYGEFERAVQALLMQAEII